jgi:hypothetical protein
LTFYGPHYYYYYYSPYIASYTQDFTQITFIHLAADHEEKRVQKPINSLCRYI